jgi:hypothetical protein
MQPTNEELMAGMLHHGDSLENKHELNTPIEEGK